MQLLNCRLVQRYTVFVNNKSGIVGMPNAPIGRLGYTNSVHSPMHFDLIDTTRPQPISPPLVGSLIRFTPFMTTIPRFSELIHRSGMT